MMTPLIHPASPKIAHLWRTSPLGQNMVVSLCGKPFDGFSSFRSSLQEPGPKAVVCPVCQQVEKAA